MCVCVWRAAHTYNEQLCPPVLGLGGDGLMEGRRGDHYAELLANNLACTNPLAMTVSLLRPP